MLQIKSCAANEKLDSLRRLDTRRQYYTAELFQTIATTICLTKRKSGKSKTFWIAFVVIFVMTLLVMVVSIWFVRRKLHSERVITTNYMELDSLAGHMQLSRKDFQNLRWV